MGCFGFHHFGTFLLFTSVILFIVASVSSPVVSSISFLTVTLTNGTSSGNSSVTFGALGECIRNPGADDYCSSVGVGYNVTDLAGVATNEDWINESLNGLTKGLVLHPLVAGLAFVAFVIAGLSHGLGFVFSAVLASFVWVLALIALIVDAVLFTIVKNHINNADLGPSASYGVALWVTVAGVVTLFLGSISTLFACVTDRRAAKY
ncbi:PalI-related protein [Pseudohyphozyma bogoriensis]|nr:PalI-related protein [Pseudohyphozyma bogoriensis]